MAIAERTLAAQFNTSAHEIVDHHTYVFLGDGCLMEGISHEACSLAGTLGSGKLIAVYDDNGISIDGEVEGWFTDDTVKRFESYGWQVISAIDGHDSDAIVRAFKEARADTTKPTLICARTTIGFGSPNKQGKESSHGAPLGPDEVKLAREQLGWEYEAFEIPNEIYTQWNACEAGEKRESAWQTLFASYKAENPEKALEFERRMAGELPDNWQADATAFIESVAEKAESIASRKASQNALNGLGPSLPEFIGGSADLAGSNLTIWSGSKEILHNKEGNYINYGVREFAMTAISNGICLHGGFLPYSATFLMFSEYSRNALRMAALMGLRNIFVFTHDSIGLGEDGPTHQPVEQAATLRLMPNMAVWRPGDAVESAVAWKMAVEREEGPTSLIFSRQSLDHQERNEQQMVAIERGGYVLHEPDGSPDAILIAAGSEVGLAMQAAVALQSNGVAVRVVSMPCTNRFDQQDQAYRDSVLPPANRVRIAVEAGASDGWRKYVGLDGDVLGLDSFGESGPAAKVFSHFGFTVENLTKRVNDCIARNA
jgi:transketolase